MTVQTGTREQLLRLASAWCEQTGRSDLEGFERLLADDSVVYGLALGGDMLRGSLSVCQVYQRLSALYPQRECRMIDAVIEDEKVAVRWAMAFGAGEPNWRLENGQIEGISILRIRDGRIAEIWTNFGRWWV
jgi:hypothetical protein